MRWTLADMPDQTGRTVLVTGATSGLGLHSATALAAAGARVLLTVRDPERGEAALEHVRRGAAARPATAASPTDGRPADAHGTDGRQAAAAGGSVAGDAPPGRPDPELVELDLADLDSVRRAAADVRERTDDVLHVLMNNAGVMGTPPVTTVDGFELQIATNHLGHAALTWLLMPALRAASAAPGVDAARVVTLSSLAHRGGGLDVDDLHFHRRAYLAGRAYSQSKLANLLFAAELDRRLRAAGDDVLSVAAHPGVTGTELLPNSIRRRNPLLAMFSIPLNKVFTQDVRTGMLPQLYAATAPDVRGGDYVGPGGPGELFGRPAAARRSSAARDEQLARRLWEVTADTTGVVPDPA